MWAVLVYAATYIDTLFNFHDGKLLNGYAGTVAKILAWAGYWLCTGSIGFGVWVIGHECEYDCSHFILLAQSVCLQTIVFQALPVHVLIITSCL